MPAISPNNVTPRLLEDDGDTVVLGGVFRVEATTTVSKTMFLETYLISVVYSDGLKTLRQKLNYSFLSPHLLSKIYRVGRLCGSSLSISLNEKFC